MVKKSEVLMEIALEISATKVKVEILGLWDVVDTLNLAYGTVIVHVRLAMEQELEDARGESEVVEVEG